MKSLKYILLEKLHIDKGTDVDFDAFELLEPGDIVYTFGIHILFYRVSRVKGQTVYLYEIPVNLVQGYYNSVKYIAEPNEELEKTVELKCRKLKNGNYSIDGIKRSCLLKYDGNPVECHGNF